MTPSKKSLDLRVSAKKKEKKRKINKYLILLRLCQVIVLEKINIYNKHKFN
jgi:hypothetical protein